MPGTDILFFSQMPDLGGGAQRSLLNIAVESKRRGYKVHVIVGKKDALSQELSKNNIPCSVIPFSWWTGKQDEHVKRLAGRSILEMIKLLERLQPKVCVTNTIVSPSLAVAAAVKRKPHIWFIREFGKKDHGFEFRFDLEETYRLIDELSDAVFFNSKAVQEHYRPFITKKTYIKYPPMDSSIFSNTSYQKPDALRNKTFNLVNVATVQKGKGQLDAIKALKALLSQGLEAELHFMGKTVDKSYRNLLKSEVRKNKLNNFVHFHGHVDNPYPYIQNADAVLVCSRQEAFGRTTVEAMLLKTPVVATGTGGTLELGKDEKSFLLYDPGDSKSLADKVKSLMNNKAKAKQITEAAYKNALGVFGPNNYRSDFYTVIDELIKSPSKTINLSVIEDISDVLRLDEQKAVKELDQKINSLEQKLKNVNNQLELVVNSRGWKALEKVRKLKPKR